MDTALVHDENKDMRTIDFPNPVPHFSGMSVVKVLSGGYHCLAVCITDSGKHELYAWGSGDQGQLGMGNTMFAVLEPGVVPFPFKEDEDSLASVAAGVWCTFIVTARGEVYVCGANFSGVLGLPQVSEGVSIATFSRVRFPPSYGQVSVKSVSCGLFHSCALARDGRVFSWGGGTMGQLGHGDRASLMEPKVVSSLEKELVLEVFAADTHSLFVVDRDGEGKDLMTCGYGRDGQLGQKKDLFSPKPRRISGIEKLNIKCVAVGGEHNAFVTEEGKVYTWGRNTRGQLGHGKRRSTGSITHVSHLRKPALSVSAGYQHTIVIMESGQLSVFGHGRFGQLGHGELEDETKPRYCIDISGTCVQANGGREHTLCLMADGSVLNWGSSHSIYGHRAQEKANEIKEDFVDTLAGMMLEELDEGGEGGPPIL